MEVHADILNLVGIDRSVFSIVGEDIKFKHEESDVRVFRRGSKLVYRTGNAVDWWGEFSQTDRSDH